ncbi:MAG: response regulator transcription factor [Woeseiaceae bacterium]
MRLLVIEDDTTLRESLSRRLEEQGFAVEQAADGKEGLYFASEYPIDLAIIDLGLPEVSGIDIIKQVRADGHSYPILILTARDRWEDKVDGLSAGADDYVVKPFHFEEVNARVAALLRRSIIEYLMVRAGQVVSKSELTDRLYDQDFERDSNVIEVFIGRLRKKLDPDNTIKPIETLRGRGYRFALERNQVD